MKGQTDFDVLVIGGGLVGAACALALRGSGLALALVEANEVAICPTDSSWDSRIYAISPGNVAFLTRLGVWQELDQQRIAPIEEMQIWGNDNAALDFSAYEAGAPALGYIVESRLMLAGLWEELQEAPEITLFSSSPGSCLDLQEEGAVLKLVDGRRLSAALVIAADGGNSWVRAEAGISVTTSDYRQQGVVANFVVERPHRNIARQWFVEDGILAWLPLPGNRMSMVWSTSNAHAKALLALSPEALAERVAMAGGDALGSMQVLTPAAAFPLRRQDAEVMVSPRLALMGDAAHLVHPLAGQGVNLGFHDAACMARVLMERGRQTDVGDYGLLRRYERARQLDIRAMQVMTGSLQALFSSELPGIALLRSKGLSFTNRQQWLKRRLIAHAMT